MNELHGILFAYRSDARLGELTRPRNTCSLPFGGRYRLIDFMLSNYVNAGILPPFSYAEHGHGEYKGNMDALAGVAGYLSTIRQEYVIMGWGDIVLNLPVADVLEQHISSGADITMVCTPTPTGAPRYSEYVEVSGDGRVTDLSVHPSSSDQSLESLEIYIMSKSLLLDMVDYCAAHDLHSFSRGVLPPRLKSLKLIPYIHKGYVARFQSVSDYYQNSMDLLGPTVRADLFNPERPIRTKDQSNPSTYYGPDSVSRCSLVADGCFIEGEVENSILSRGVTVEKGAKVTNSVLMQGTVVRAGASLSYVIADKNVQVKDGRVLTGHFTYPLAISKGSVV